MESAEPAPNQATPSPHVRDDRASVVGAFINGLTERYRRLEGTPAADVEPSTIERRLTELVLAEAALRHSASPHAARPLQVAVMGPTQTGKSTVVNLLLGSNVAQVSPLAGYTVHPQGFWLTSADRNTRWFANLFPGWPRCEPEELTRDRLDTYALSLIDADREHAAVPPCVIWDTPDFDSLAARTYRRGLLEVAALADAIVLVLSKEKYSDLSVWTLLRLIQPLGRPLVVCLNKLTPDAADVVTNSLRQRLAEIDGAHDTAPIVPVAYVPGMASDAGMLPPADGESLRTHLRACLTVPDQRSRIRAVQVLIRRHWDDWVAPLRAEHAAAKAWTELLDESLARFLEAYRRDYLDHPQRYDSFRRAALELLQLLEIPQISAWMTRARKVATWPARRLLSAGRSWWRRQGSRVRHELGTEAAVLVDAVDALLTGLQRDASRRSASDAPGHRVWYALADRLDRDESRLRQVFRGAIEEHHRQVTREINAAANELYEELQHQPTRLAALRTARATIDVGYLLIAVKTGGLTPLDALWAPATFGVTSLLMEGIAGVQMGHVGRNLKERQFSAVQKTLVQTVFVRELRALVTNLNDEGLFAIPPESLNDATVALTDWERTCDG